jgi:site-specific DNA recombinase
VYRKKLKDKKIKLVSIIENFDESPESQLLTNMIEGFAEYFSANLAREVMKGLKENALKAKHTGGTPPLGYDVAPDKSYVLNTDEANTIALIFDLYINGYGYNNIIKELNSRGYKTKNKNSFGKNSIFDILKNEKYTGTYVYNKRANGTNRTYKSDDEIIKIENGLPAIITKEQFKFVQNKMKGRERVMSDKSKRNYVLTGHVGCGECGSAYIGNGYYGNGHGAKYYQYSCTNRANKKGCTNKNLNQEKLEAMIIEDLQKHIFSDIDGLAKKATDFAKVKGSQTGEEIKQLSKKVKEYQCKMDTLLDYLLDGKIDKESFEKKNSALMEDKNMLKARIQEISVKPTREYTESNFKEFLYAMKNKLESNDPKLIHQVIKTFNLNILVYPEHYELHMSVVGLVELNHTQRYH